jgi:hypothetical protein
MFQVKWSKPSVLSLNFAILYDVKLSVRILCSPLMQQLIPSIISERYFGLLVYDQMVSLPRQHSLIHYRRLIQMFGAPNGLCSSITESKHIKAVKKPWRRSSRNHALGQILLTNQRLDKLAAARVDFTARGMMQGHGFALPQPQVNIILEDDEEMDQGADEHPKCLGEVKLAKTVTLGGYFLCLN